MPRLYLTLQKRSETMKVLITAKSFLGEVLYRVTGDSIKVNVQRRQANQVTWKTMRTIPRSEFDIEARESGLFDPYRQDPALLRDLGETFFNNPNDSGNEEHR
jgi:hypothetical protein